MTRKKLKLKKSIKDRKQGTQGIQEKVHIKSNKTLTLNERDLKIIVLGLRFAMVQEIEWQGSYNHCKDKESQELKKESEKLIIKFKKLGRKIQNILQGETL